MGKHEQLEMISNALMEQFVVRVLLIGERLELDECEEEHETMRSVDTILSLSENIPELIRYLRDVKKDPSIQDLMEINPEVIDFLLLQFHTLREKTRGQSFHREAKAMIMKIQKKAEEWRQENKTVFAMGR